jgi:hypothetical protein
MPIIGSVRVGMANAPSNPAEGELYYDTDNDALYAYSGTAWGKIGGASATGGTITTYSGYKVHTFLLAQSGNDFVVNENLTVDYLIVAGGGGGGSEGAGATQGAGGNGGGGAGAYGSNTGTAGTANTGGGGGGSTNNGTGGAGGSGIVVIRYAA